MFKGSLHMRKRAKQTCEDTDGRRVQRAGGNAVPLLCTLHACAWCRCSMRVLGCRKVVPQVQQRQLAQAYQMLHPLTSKQRSTGSKY